MLSGMQEGGGYGVCCCWLFGVRGALLNMLESLFAADKDDPCIIDSLGVIWDCLTIIILDCRTY